MKYHNRHKELSQRYGASIEQGKAHSEVHEFWNRRNFLKTTGLTALSTMISLEGKAISQLMPNALTRAIMDNDSDRVLVLIRLDGGNDGLNTVIHRGNDEYYNIRPSLAIPETGLWALDDAFGMPDTMVDLEPFWKDGKMKIVHNVGYPQPNYSHFRSSDIWASASGSNEYVGTGWIGRAMESVFPSYLDTPPTVPPAIQIGIESNLIFQGSNSNLALSINNPTQFYRIAQQGQLYDTADLGDCPSESELKFVRQTANSAFRYSESIQEAYKKGINKAQYQNSDLAEQLAIVARLIKGRLGTKVYMVTIGGFDTHSEQANYHPELMNELSNAIAQFYTDLEEGGFGDKVLSMTFSEFGRTIFENGSNGTDHGTGTPILIFGGEALGNGFVGEAPDLINTGPYGDPEFDIDFRSVYASVLKDWLGLDQRVVDHVIGDKPYISNLVPIADIPQGLNAAEVLLGYKSVDGSNHIDIRYSISRSGITRLSLLNLSGFPIRDLFNTFRERGSYSYLLRPEKDLVNPGSYILQCESGGKRYTRTIMVK